MYRNIRGVIAGIILIAITLLLGGCGQREAGYTSPERVNSGVVEVSNSIVKNGRTCLNDNDARELVKLCAGGGVEGALTNFLFRIADMTDNKFEVKFVDNGVNRIDDNKAIGKVEVKCIYHGGRILGDKVLSQDMNLVIERERNLIPLISEESQFWYITDVKKEHSNKDEVGNNI